MSTEIRELVADLAGIVRVQNGNLYDDINQLLERAESYLGATTHTQPAGCDLDSLEALEKASTPGPWDIETVRSEGEYGTDEDGGRGFDAYAVVDSKGRPMLDSLNRDDSSIHTDTDGDVLYAWDELAKRDAQFIVAAKNAMPALIAAARAAQAPQGDTRRSVEDELTWHKKALAAVNGKLEAVWKGIEEAIEKYSGVKCEGEPFNRLDELLSRLATPAAHTCTPADERALWKEYDEAIQSPMVSNAIDAKIKALRARLIETIARAAQGAGTAPVGDQPQLPDGWIPLSIVYNNDMEYPEEVAYGPPIMMNRLGKWLDKFLAQEIAMRDGMVLAPHFRGYANLGLGAYILNHSGEGEPAELVISIATDEEKEGRTVGDLRDNTPGAMVQPETMAVRLRFENVAGLDALEQQLAFVRSIHFPKLTHPAPVSTAAATTASASEPKAVQIFTCKGKGGEYELIGYSNGAGPKRGESIVVYRRTSEPDVLYHRSTDDFRERMEWLGGRAPSRAADGQQGASRAALDELRLKLRAEVLAAVRHLAECEHEDAQNRGKGGPGVFKKVEAAQARVVVAVDAIAAIARAPLPAQGAAQVEVESARDAVLEEAAKVCEVREDEHKYGSFWNSTKGEEAGACANAIRALKSNRAALAAKRGGPTDA